MADPVYVIGAGRTDFKRNLKKENKTLRHIILESAQAAIAAAQINIGKYGLTERQLAKVAVKNFAHARKNPLAQMRDTALTVEQAATASDQNPSFAPPLKTTDCSQITDGAAALILCSGRFTKKLDAGRRAIRLLGYGHTTDYLPLAKKDAPEFSMARRAAAKAYAMAGLGPS